MNESEWGELRTVVLSGDVSALSVHNDALRELGPLSARYLDGECAAVWDTLVALGDRVRAPEVWPIAWGVAWETMRRTRENLKVVIQRLGDCGYQFKRPQRVLGSAASAEELQQLVDLAGGPPPLSIHAFWAVVGSVDLAQSLEQTRHDWLEHVDPADELSRLGDDDPLVVASVSELLEEEQTRRSSPARARLRRRTFDEEVLGRELEEDESGFSVCFSADRFHKANVSGGYDYNFFVPNRAADFRVFGDVCAGDEWSARDFEGNWFVRILRQTLSNGGFRGKLDDEGLRWLAPRQLYARLSAGLQPI